MTTINTVTLNAVTVLELLSSNLDSFVRLLSLYEVETILLGASFFREVPSKSRPNPIQGTVTGLLQVRLVGIHIRVTPFLTQANRNYITQALPIFYRNAEPHLGFSFLAGSANFKLKRVTRACSCVYFSGSISISPRYFAQTNSPCTGPADARDN